MLSEQQLITYSILYQLLLAMKNTGERIKASALLERGMRGGQRYK